MNIKQIIMKTKLNKFDKSVKNCVAINMLFKIVLIGPIKLKSL